MLCWACWALMLFPLLYIIFFPQFCIMPFIYLVIHPFIWLANLCSTC